ncbi:MAG: glycosyltransferase family 2 protein [Candidatus Pacebacteria bacterium]|nr:glycosyltransferase family 2 protein [Candidatus Paceibacterota bacterium]
MFDVPIVFIIFKRPETTQKVFDEIRKVKPKKLFIVADGPRNKEEKIKCEKTRVIVEKINWDCEVFRNYSEENLGCRKRVISGLNWVFKNVEKCIILEDDCLPDQSFFPFCEKLLERYKKREDVMMISGNNHLKDKKNIIKDSYYFTKFTYIWGWATWRSSWKLMQDNLTISNKVIYSNFSNWKDRIYWKYVFKETEKGYIDSWAYSLFYYSLNNEMQNICPKVNLVANIGFGDDSTNTGNYNDTYSLIKKETISFPLNHPEEIRINKKADKISQKNSVNMSLFRFFLKHILKQIGLFSYFKKIYYKMIN